VNIQDLTVADLMSTALVTATPDETVGAADIDMKIANIHHLPVIDRRNQLCGIVSDRDLLVALTRSKTVRIRDVMTKKVLTVSETAPAWEAAEIMVESRIHALPVEGEDGQLVGVVTESDFLRVFVGEGHRRDREAI
jgi:CBS domain-containing protein